MTAEICYLSATRLVKAMKSRKLSAVDVMEAHLDRIEKINPLLNGLVQRFSREESLKSAILADQELSKGRQTGRLHGLPVTIKDMLLVKGLVSCAGCSGLKNKIADEDSTIVSRLKKEGAIIVGITNTPEFLSSYETDNSVYGRTNNPYDLKRTPGGSSGGCAALVASGCSPLSIGSDAAGSIRWPAHCTGIAGHKPTTCLVPRTGSCMGNGRGLIGQFATHGPLARYAEDLALILPIISGPDGHDPHIPPVHLNDPKEVDIPRLRIAYVLEDGVSSLSDEIIENLEQVVKVLQKHIAKVDPIQLECLKDSYRLMWEGFYLGGDRGEGLKNILRMLGVETPSPLLQKFLLSAEKNELTVTQFRNLFREIDLYRIKMLESLADYDILLSPVAATAAKLHGTASDECQDMTFCMVHSLTGWPATVIRCGTSPSGLPMGIQIAAKSWNDHLTIALAEKMESIFGGWRPPPPTFKVM